MLEINQNSYSLCLLLRSGRHISTPKPDGPCLIIGVRVVWERELRPKSRCTSFLIQLNIVVLILQEIGEVATTTWR